MSPERAQSLECRTGVPGLADVLCSYSTRFFEQHGLFVRRRLPVVSLHSDEYHDAVERGCGMIEFVNEFGTFVVVFDETK